MSLNLLIFKLLKLYVCFGHNLTSIIFVIVLTMRGHNRTRMQLSTYCSTTRLPKGRSLLTVECTIS